MTLEGAIRAAAKRGELIRDPQATLDELVQLRAEVRALRKKVDVTCGYLSDRVELRWDDELIRVVTEWRDASMSARSGEGGMGIKSTVEYEFPRWPNFIRQKVAPRPRQEGVNFDAPYLDVGELTVEQIDALVQNFREHCAKRAAAIGE